MKIYEFTEVKSDGDHVTNSVESENARGAKSKINKLKRDGEIHDFLLPDRMSGKKIENENKKSDKGNFEPTDENNDFNDTANFQHQETDKTLETTQVEDNHKFDIGEAGSSKKSNHNSNNSSFYGTAKPKQIKQTDGFKPDELPQQPDFDNEQKETAKKLQTGDSMVIASMIPTFLTTLMTVLNSFLPKKIFKISKFSSDEKRILKDGFNDAFPDTKVNPKLAFFGIVAMVLGGRIDTQKFKDNE